MTPMALIFEDSSAVSTGAEVIAQDDRVGPIKPSSHRKMESNGRTTEERGQDLALPEVPFTRALTMDGKTEDGQQKQLPQAIAHRGYKAVYPENTMCAFKAAVEIGAHAIETDLHLSKDGVVVLSHDGTLKRCFGIDKKINECTWEYLSTLRTLRQPSEPMSRLVDLLEYLAAPEHERLWILLDVKIDDDAEELLTLTRQTIENAAVARCSEAGAARQWKDRIVFGGWNQHYVSLITALLPGYGAAHIGFNLSYARRFLQVPNVGFNMLQKVLVGPFGTRFIRDVQAANRPLFVWTVDDEEWMEWSIKRNVDGVITDDPKMFLELCRRWIDEEEESTDGKDNEGDVTVGRGTKMEMEKRRGVNKTSMGRRTRLYADVAWTQLMAWVLGFFFFNLWRPKSRRGKKLG